MRKSGYYWIRFSEKHKWIIAEWEGNDWWTIGSTRPLYSPPKFILEERIKFTNDD